MVTALLVLQLVLPNLTMTPGVVRPLSKATICTTRWGFDKRHVTVGMKKRVAAAYGVPWAERKFYEFDHLVPRSLGGKDDELNLWPQPLWEAKHLKDPQEVALGKLVCAGTITLSDAQEQMRHWGR